MKWSEVKGSWITEEIEYFQEQGLESDKWREVKGRKFEVKRKSSIFRERGWNVIIEVKWSEVKGFWITEEIEYFQEQGLESDKWNDVKGKELKWGEDQLSALKESELRRSGVWSGYDGSEVEWGVGLGETCVIVYCTLWFAHCSVYRVVFNTDSSTSILGSIRFWVLIGYNMFSLFFVVVILRIEGCRECCMLFVLRYCIVLYCPVLHCSTLPPGINPFAVNNNNNNNNNNFQFSLWWLWKLLTKTTITKNLAPCSVVKLSLHFRGTRKGDGGSRGFSAMLCHISTRLHEVSSQKTKPHYSYICYARCCRNLKK
jgi:hypothetical protein